MANAIIKMSVVKVMNLAQYDDIHEYVSASAVTDIYYIAYKQIKDRKLVLDLIKRLLVVVSIAAVTEQEIRNALETGCVKSTKAFWKKNALICLIIVCMT